MRFTRAARRKRRLPRRSPYVFYLSTPSYSTTFLVAGLSLTLHIIFLQPFICRSSLSSTDVSRPHFVLLLCTPYVFYVLTRSLGYLLCHLFRIILRPHLSHDYKIAPSRSHHLILGQIKPHTSDMFTLIFFINHSRTICGCSLTQLTFRSKIAKSANYFYSKSYSLLFY